METLPALLFSSFCLLYRKSRWLFVAREERSPTIRSLFSGRFISPERAGEKQVELQAYIANETKSEFKYLFQPGILTACRCRIMYCDFGTVYGCKCCFCIAG